MKDVAAAAHPCIQPAARAIMEDRFSLLNPTPDFNRPPENIAVGYRSMVMEQHLHFVETWTTLLFLPYGRDEEHVVPPQLHTMWQLLRDIHLLLARSTDTPANEIADQVCMQPAKHYDTFCFADSHLEFKSHLQIAGICGHALLVSHRSLLMVMKGHRMVLCMLHRWSRRSASTDARWRHISASRRASTICICWHAGASFTCDSFKQTIM